VRHGFTHFELELLVLAASVAGKGRTEGLWWPIDRLGEQALPTLMKKLVAHALKTP
jgi:A/G-specific adenine glycosylase